MKAQTLNLGAVIVRYELGETWFDGTLELSNPGTEGEQAVRIDGTDAVVALRDFLNSLDFSGRRLTLVRESETT